MKCLLARAGVLFHTGANDVCSASPSAHCCARKAASENSDRFLENQKLHVSLKLNLSPLKANCSFFLRRSRIPPQPAFGCDTKTNSRRKSSHHTVSLEGIGRKDIKRTIEFGMTRHRSTKKTKRKTETSNSRKNVRMPGDDREGKKRVRCDLYRKKTIF